jgi:hypothetical protein
MRLFSLACATLLSSAMALAQSPMVRPYPGAYGYGPYGPFVPLVTTPEVSLETGAPAPVGASNATHGLVAGASNATLSIVTGNTSSVYTLPVWYSGGRAPIISSPEVSLQTRAISEREFPRAARTAEEGRAEPERAHAVWTYYASSAETGSAVEAARAAKVGRPAPRTYTNQDIERQNQTNGTVKYDGKTEQIR